MKTKNILFSICGVALAAFAIFDLASCAKETKNQKEVVAMNNNNINNGNNNSVIKNDEDKKEIVIIEKDKDDTSIPEIEVIIKEEKVPYWNFNGEALKETSFWVGNDVDRYNFSKEIDTNSDYKIFDKNNTEIASKIVNLEVGENLFVVTTEKESVEITIIRNATTKIRMYDTLNGVEYFNNELVFSNGSLAELPILEAKEVDYFYGWSLEDSSESFRSIELENSFEEKELILKANCDYRYFTINNKISPTEYVAVLRNAYSDVELQRVIRKGYNLIQIKVTHENGEVEVIDVDTKHFYITLDKPELLLIEYIYEPIQFKITYGYLEKTLTYGENFILYDSFVSSPQTVNYVMLDRNILGLSGTFDLDYSIRDGNGIVVSVPVKELEVIRK